MGGIEGGRTKSWREEPGVNPGVIRPGVIGTPGHRAIDRVRFVDIVDVAIVLLMFAILCLSRA